MKELLPCLDSKDEDISYLLENKEDLSLSVAVYFNKSPDNVRKMFSKYPNFFRTESHFASFTPTAWEKYILRHKEKSKTYIRDKLIGNFFENELDTEIVSPSFLTDISPNFLRMFGINIEGDGKKVFDLPFENDLYFSPLSLLFNDYLNYKEASTLTNFYQENRHIFDELNLHYFGFTTIQGSDCSNLNKILGKLDRKYNIFNSEESFSIPFMSSIYNNEELNLKISNLKQQKLL